MEYIKNKKRYNKLVKERKELVEKLEKLLDNKESHFKKTLDYKGTKKINANKVYFCFVSREKLVIEQIKQKDHDIRKLCTP